MPDAPSIHPVEAAIHFLPVQTRVPLKFGPETLTYVTCARVRMRVEDQRGRSAEGWGETPLSVQWVWPSKLPYETRHQALRAFSVALCKAWSSFKSAGHPMEVGYDFQQHILPNVPRPAQGSSDEEMPYLAALVCCSAFDLALHDAYGNLVDLPTYDTYAPPFMRRDLGAYLTPAEGSWLSFARKYPKDFLQYPRQHASRVAPCWRARSAGRRRPQGR